MKKTKLFIAVLILLFPTMALPNMPKSAIREVQKTIEDAYINGVFLKGDMDLIKAGWHEECDIVYFNPESRTVQKGNAINYFEDYFKKKPGPVNEDIAWEFIDIKIAGNAALAVVEISNKLKTKKIYTDFLNLYRIQNKEWKIVSKTFFAHK